MLKTWSRTTVPCVFTRSRANVLECLRAQLLMRFTWQLALSGYMHHMSTCLACLCTHMSTWLPSSRAHVPTSLWSLVSYGLCDHVITCQHALPPREVVLMRLFFEFHCHFLLKLYTLSVRF